MKIIQLTQGKTAMIDDEDFARVSKHSWCFYKVGSGYAQAKINKKVTSLHRFIMMAPKGSIVDHIDRNGFNCQKSNLRFVTSRENMNNRINNKPKVKNWKSYLPE